MELHNLSADVLIVGGGLAGVNAAMAAAEKGATVLVADKGNINRSGAIGGGVDHFLAFLNEGAEWDTQDAFLEYLLVKALTVVAGVKTSRFDAQLIHILKVFFKKA